MFQFIEKQKKLIQILLGLVALTFMTWGIQSYTQFRGQSDAVATIDGSKITQREYSEALQRQQDRLRQAFGNRIDPDELDTPQMRQAVLDDMINNRLVATAAVKNRLMVSNDALRQAILAIPAFHEHGRFSKSAYEAVLRSQGLTQQMFEANMRYELSLAQLTTAVKDSAIPSRTVTAHLMQLLEEQRQISQALVPVQPFLAKVTVDAAQAKAYYDSHPDQFSVPERVKAQYVVLSADALAKDVPVSEAELKAAYDSQPSRFRTDEQRRASHILIQVAPDAKPAVREAALKKAEKILAEVRKSPDKFAELAKKDSQDPGSAEKGGDLGYFNRGMMVKPFADAVFSLKKVGDISGVVKSEYGYHIIKLTGIQPSRTRSLDDVRSQLTAQLRKQKATAQFTKDAETFSDIVFEQSDSLQPVADRFKLKLQTTGWITKAADKAPPPLNNPKLIRSLFSDDAVNHKRNTDSVQVAPDTMVAARVLEHQSATLRKFADVKDQIEKKLQHDEALKLAGKDGAAIVSKLRLGENVGLKWGAPELVSRRDPKGLSQAALQKVVAADVSKLPSYVGAEKDGAGYAIYRISKVVEPAKKTDAQSAADLSRIEAIEGAADYDAYVAGLRKRAEIEINKKNLERR